MVSRECQLRVLGVLDDRKGAASALRHVSRAVVPVLLVRNHHTSWKTIYRPEEVPMGYLASVRMLDCRRAWLTTFVRCGIVSDVCVRK